MAREHKKESARIKPSWDRSSLLDKISKLSTFEAIKSIVESNANSELNDQRKLDLFLCHWWSNKFNRPLKDPILLSYTTEELLYEYYDNIEREKVEQERIEEEGDKIEDDKLQETVDWAEAEEKKELERLKAKEQEKVTEQSEEDEDPMANPANKDWVEKELEKAKELLGDDFGEDVNLDFTE